MTDSTDNARGPDWEAPKELYFYDDWLRQNTNDKILCGNNRYIRADLDLGPQDEKIKALVEKAQALLDLNDNYSPFGGEIYRDRVDRTWDEFRAALAAFDKGGKDE